MSGISCSSRLLAVSQRAGLTDEMQTALNKKRGLARTLILPVRYYAFLYSSHATFTTVGSSGVSELLDRARSWKIRAGHKDLIRDPGTRKPEESLGTDTF